MSQMAGWDFDTFGVFVQPAMGDFVTLTAVRGGIEQFSEPLSRRPWVPPAACLLLLIRPVTGGDVFLSFAVFFLSCTQLCSRLLFFKILFFVIIIINSIMFFL